MKFKSSSRSAGEIILLKGSEMADSQNEPGFFNPPMFTKIFQTFRMAIHPSKLAIAFAAVALICLAGTIMDFTGTVVTEPATDGKMTELQIYLTDSEQLDSFIETNKGLEKGTGVFSVLWSFAADRFKNAVDSVLRLNFPGAIDNIALYLKALGWAFKHHFIYCIIFSVIKLAIICIAGGAICRISALQFALGEKPGISEAIRYSYRKFASFVAAPLAPVGVSLFLGLCIFLIGLLGNIPRVGEILVAVGIVLSLVCGTLITIVLIGAIGSFNLMFPALAYDGLDCFDAISRSFNYVYSRPWRMGFYTAVAAVYGAICYMFVRFFAFLLLLTTYSSLRLGVFVKGAEGINKLEAIWPKPEFTNLLSSAADAANWTESVSAFLLYLCLLIVVGMVVAFILSFYFTANTVIYALMRNKVDNTALDEIHTTTEQFDAEPPAVKDKKDKKGKTSKTAETNESDG